MQEPPPVTSSARRSCAQGPRQRFGEKIKLVIRCDADPDASVEPLGARHAHKDAVRDQGIQHALGEGAVTAAVDGDEVRGRRKRLKPFTACDDPDALAGPADFFDHFLEIGPVGKGRERCRLRQAIDTEMVALCRSI